MYLANLFKEALELAAKERDKVASLDSDGSGFGRGGYFERRGDHITQATFVKVCRKHRIGIPTYFLNQPALLFPDENWSLVNFHFLTVEWETNLHNFLKGVAAVELSSCPADTVSEMQKAVTRARFVFRDVSLAREKADAKVVRG
jgi:hypothetical protein